MLHADCPANGARLTRADCAAIEARARTWQTPPTEVRVVWDATPRSGAK